MLHVQSAMCIRTSRQILYLRLDCLNLATSGSRNTDAYDTGKQGSAQLCTAYVALCVTLAKGTQKSHVEGAGA